MSDGLFNSSSSSYHHYSSSDDGPKTLGEFLVYLVILLMALGIVVCINEIVEGAERQNDKTVYAVQASENLETWLEKQDYDVKEGTLWIESGSSHQDNYHCKGGQFQTNQGQTVTFCCSVVVSNTPCMVIY